MDMANKGITISIDAKLQLQNLDNERKRLADAFSKVDVGSKSYKELERELKAINKAYEDTAKLAGGAFHTQADVDKYIRKYEKLQTVMKDFDSSYAKLGSGDFTDKIFPSGFLAKLSQAEKDFKQAQKDYADLGDSLFEKAVKSKQNLHTVLAGEGVKDNASYGEMEKALNQAYSAATKSEANFAAAVQKSQTAIQSLTDHLKDLNDEKTKMVALNSQLQTDINTKQSKIAADEATFATTKANEEERINKIYESRLASLENLNKALKTKTDQRQGIMPQIFTNGSGFKENKESIADFLVQQAMAAGVQGITKNDLMSASRDKILDVSKAIQDAINAQKSQETAIVEQNYKSSMAGLQPERDALQKLEDQLKDEQNKLATLQKSINRQEAQLKRRQNQMTQEEQSRQNAEQKKQDVSNAQVELKAAQNDSQNALNNSAAKTNMDKAKKDWDDLSDAQKQFIINAMNAGRSSANLGDNFNQMGDQAQEAKRQIDQLDQMQTKLKNGVTNVVNRYLGFYAILNKVRAAVRTMINDIRELDKAITEIAIVTNFSQDDLWKQIPTYSAMAKEYGTSIKGVYEITQLYYQQGKFLFNFFTFLLDKYKNICYN